MEDKILMEIIEEEQKQEAEALSAYEQYEKEEQRKGVEIDYLTMLKIYEGLFGIV